MKRDNKIAEAFLGLCGISKSSANFEIVLRKQIEKTTSEKNIPDIQFLWNDSFKLFIEAKLDSPINDEQLLRYKRGLKRRGDIVCITRAAGEKTMNGIKFVSWEDIYSKFNSLNSTNSRIEQFRKDFLEYLNYLGISKR